MITVSLPTKRLNAYDKLVNRSVISSISTIGKKLYGKRIVEINSTAEGGGVAEMLKSYIPLLTDIGIQSSWRVLMPDSKFFGITKNIHNCLQGICPIPPTHEIEYYSNYLARQARYIPPADLYVLHDPQTLGLIPHLPEGVPVIWRCHIDLTSADSSSLEWVREYYKKINKVIFSLDNYALGIEKDKIVIIEPAIDPLTEKNAELSDSEITAALSEFNINTDKPFITQISRFDQFKDPIGVLEMYAQVKKHKPDLGCVLMGSYATDDPEGYPYFQKLRAKITELKLPDIKLVTKEDDRLVNALQRAATCVIQNSSREGFGLTVTEALWKQNIVLARPVGGIALQVINKKTGLYLLGDVAHDVPVLLDVVSNRQKYASMGKNAQEHVRKNFLITRMLEDHVRLYAQVLGLD